MKMLKTILISLSLMSVLFAQGLDPFGSENNSSVNGGLGMTWIDGTAYTTVTISPEFAFGKFGVGLNLELLFNNSSGFKFRDDGWKTGAGALRMIRYLRWGVKHDPLYIRLGSLQTALIGNGFIMGYYSNEVNYDYRKIGLVMDVDLNTFGIETMTSNLGRLEIIGGRLYYRPLSASGLPVFKNLEFGASYVTDVDPDGSRATNDAVAEWGVDVGLPIIKTSFFNTTVYGDFAQILNHGHGMAAGIRADMPNVLGLFSIYAKLERRFLGDHFIANYYNTMYELERGPLDASHYGFADGALGTLTKEGSLKYIKGAQGIFGELAGQILGKIRLAGNYQHSNGIKNSGILHLEARSNDLIPNIQIKYAYDKVGIETFTDARTLDYRSLAIAEFGYRTYQFIYLSLQYRWNFVWDAKKQAYKPQERFQPSISFSMNF